MKSYDKASWHIDGGETEEDVVARFKVIFIFLADMKMLSDDGLETLEYGMDSSVSLNSTMVNTDGEKFLDTYYEVIIAKNPKEIQKNLKSAYEEFKGVEQ